MDLYSESLVSTDNQLTIRFGGNGNIHLETLTNFLNEYRVLFQIVNSELGYKPDDFTIEVSPPENGSFKIKLKSKYKDLILNKFGDLSVGVVLTLLAIFTTGLNNNAELSDIKKLLEDMNVKDEEAPKIVQNVYQNTNAVKNIQQTFIIVNNDENITDLKIEKKDVEVINIKRTDFAKYAESVNIEEQEDIVQSDVLTDEVSLVIKTLHFEGQAKWGFVFRGYPIKASIKDEKFLESLGSESFSKGDVLKVRLSRERNYDIELQTYIVDVNSYVIEKVVAHISKKNTQTEIENLE